MLDMEVTTLHWPSFCYTRDQAKYGKRKWEEEVRSDCSSPDQAVPEININKRIKTDLPFSTLMRSMAAKYQTKQDTTTPIHNPLMSIFSPLNNPYSSLMTSMARISNPKQNISSQPLDLSSGASEQEVDVVSLEDEGDKPLDQWTCHQVRDFIEKIESCEEYADIFYNEKIDGATLSVLSLNHLTTFLGVKMGHALQILRRREERRELQITVS